MTTVEAYLRANYAGEETAGVSMESESKFGRIFGSFELPSIYGTQKITSGPWNRPGSEYHYTDEWLDRAEYRKEAKSFEAPVAAWLMLGGEPLGDAVFRALEAEVKMYQVIIGMVQTRIFAFLGWAQMTTYRLDVINKDVELARRPKTAAEILSEVRPCLLGMREKAPLVKVSPFRGDVLVTFQVPQRPDYGQSAYPIRLDAEKAKSMVHWAARFDAIADQIDAVFPPMDVEISKLQSFRELARTDEEPHRIIQFIDREMQNPLNSEILCALFARARSIANHLRMLVWLETH